MKYPLSGILLVALLPIAFVATAQDIRSRWAGAPVVVDGSPSEWPQPFTLFNSATKLEYAIANDTANIYICVKIADEQTGMRVFRGGMHVWFDTKGKKKEGVGLSFPLKASEAGGEMPRPQGEGQTPVPGEGHTFKKHDFNEIKARIALHQVNMKVMGLFGVADQLMPLKNGYGVSAAFAWDSLNTLTIEYKIPVALVLRHYLSAADTNTAIGLGLVEDAVETNHGPRDGDPAGWGNSGAMRGGMNGNGQGAMGAGSGMGAGGGMPRGGGNYNMSNFATGQEQKLWTRILLAYRR